MSIVEISGHRVAFLMAVDAEYGPHLRARFAPVLTGVGPVEAGITATRLFAQMQIDAGTPDLVVSLGSAGSARLKHGGVYQATSIAYRDMDASPLGFEKGVTPFLDLPARLPLSHRVPGLEGASLSTGGSIISGPMYDAIAEDMVDMESFAILRACQRFDLPLIVLRGISDGKEPLSGLQDWTDYLHIVDEKLAQAVDQLAKALESGAITLRASHQ